MMIRTQIYLPSEIKKELEKISRKESIPMGEMIRKILKKSLIDNREFRKGNDMIELTKLRLKGGPRDLSSKLDEYLYSK